MIHLVQFGQLGKKISLVQSAQSGFRSMPVFKELPVVFSVGKSGWELKLTEDLNLAALQRMSGGLPLHHCN
jgi:hypothetical protein